MNETYRDLYNKAIAFVPLNYKDGKFIHPNYAAKFDGGFTWEEIERLVEAGYNKGLAIMHSKANPGLICLDFDEKNAPGVNLFESFKHLIDPMLLQKLVIERTRSNGYHLFFLCRNLPPIKALASSATGEEWIACRSAASNCITYCSPSPGYVEMQGSFDDLQELTEDDMMQLCDAARQLDKFEGVQSSKSNALPMVRPPADLYPFFKEFDRSVSVEWMQDYLDANGWTTDGMIKRKQINGETWEFMRYWRPGRDQREVPSANLWLNKKRLSVFTTSTVLPAFDSGENFSHLPSQILYYYNSRDWKLAYQVLRGEAEAGKIELPEELPMAYSVIVRNTEVWRIEIKGIIEWARRSGYQWMKIGTGQDAQRIFIRVVDNIIYDADMGELQRVYLEYVNENYQEVGANRALVQYLPSIIKYMEALPLFDMPLVRDGKDKSYIFFRNGALRITKDSALLIRYADIEGCVFARHIKDHDYEGAEDYGTFGKFIDMVSIDKDHKRFMMSALGYILHYYKIPYLAKALMIIEDVDDQEQARGRSGKGLIAQFVNSIRWTVQQDGRNFKTDSQFKMQQIVPGVQVYYLNDPAPSVLMNQLYNYISDEMLVEAKGKKSYTIPFSNSPKILITTNFLPNLESDSDKDRFVILAIKKVFGANYSIREAFPGEVFFAEDWRREDRNGSIRFAIDCLQLYLKEGIIRYENEQMRINEAMRVVKNAVPESITEVLEMAIISAGQAKSELEFINMITEIDMQKDRPESLKNCFGWEYNLLKIYVSRFYQYMVKGLRLQNYTDKRFSKALKTYVEKMRYTEIEDRRTKSAGRMIALQIKRGEDITNNIDTLEDAPF